MTLTKQIAMILAVVVLAIASSFAQGAPGVQKPAPPTSDMAEAERDVAQPAGKTGSETPTAEPGAPADQPVINNHDDKISYATGADLARDIKRQGKAMNVDLFMRALNDGLAGRPLLMTDEEIAKTLNAFEQERREGFQHAKMMVAERNKRDGEAFFAENAKKDGVITLPSGLQYKILKKGDGKIPALEDVVVCNYTGKLLDGTEFDSSYKRKEPTAIPVKGVIPGWTQALQLMPVGTKWQMFVPPQLAYGENGTAVFGPNASVVFEVELLSIQDKVAKAANTSDKARKMQSASVAK